MELDLGEVCAQMSPYSEASPGHCRWSPHSTHDPLGAVYVAICLAPVFVMRT